MSLFIKLILNEITSLVNAVFCAPDWYRKPVSDPYATKWRHR